MKLTLLRIYLDSLNNKPIINFTLYVGFMPACSLGFWSMVLSFG